MPQIIKTERLILRTWEDRDFAPFAEMNANLKVRKYFFSILTREQSDAEIRHFQSTQDRDGFCLFAAELVETSEFIGFVGLQTMSFVVGSAPQPAVELGWRLAQAHWGKGLATEGARGVVQYAFDTLRLTEVVAIAVPANLPSRRVMEKIEMKHRPELDFDHPRVPEGHPLQRHVLYFLGRDAYRSAAESR